MGKPLSCHAFKLGISSEQDARTARISPLLILSLLPPFATAIEIAATQTKSACADWVVTGVAFPGFGMTNDVACFSR